MTGGTLELDDTAWIRASLELTGGTLTATADLLVSGTVLHGNATLNGIGTVTVGDTYTWTQGIQEGAGETIFNGGLEITTTTHNLKVRTLTINGVTDSHWTGGNVNLWDAATINNNSTFDIQTDADMPHITGGSTTLNNDATATITKTVGSGLTDIQVSPFNNSGTVTVPSGMLQIDGVMY